MRARDTGKWRKFEIDQNKKRAQAKRYAAASRKEGDAAQAAAHGREVAANYTQLTTKSKAVKELSRGPFGPRPSPDSLARQSDKQLEKRARAGGVGGKVLYLAQQLAELARKGEMERREGAGSNSGGDAPVGPKVLLTPPMNPVVRERFVENLRDMIGEDALADLNEKGEMSKQLAKFNTGHSRTWQCPQCGEEHGDSVAKCRSHVARVEMNRRGRKEGVLCFFQDLVLEKEDADEEQSNYTVYPGSKVRVFRPGTDDVLGHGEVTSGGICKCPGARPDPEKDPDAASKFHTTPKHSCFVLILKPAQMEGLDLPLVRRCHARTARLRLDPQPPHSPPASRSAPRHSSPLTLDSHRQRTCTRPSLS